MKCFGRLHFSQNSEDQKNQIICLVMHNVPAGKKGLRAAHQKTRDRCQIQFFNISFDLLCAIFLVQNVLFLQVGHLPMSQTWHARLLISMPTVPFRRRKKNINLSVPRFWPIMELWKTVDSGTFWDPRRYYLYLSAARCDMPMKHSSLSQTSRCMGGTKEWERWPIINDQILGWEEKKR